MPTVLITGANRGIGLELAKQYAADGWTVIGTAREPEKADGLRAIGNAEVMQLDAADADSLDDFMAVLGDRPIDLFINNAGVYGSNDLDRDEWLKTFEINSIAPTLLAERLKPNVAASGQKKMAVLSSIMGSIGDGNGSSAIVYRSSKAAVNAAWKALSNRYREDGIAVAILHPGWVQTDMGGPNANIDVETSVTGLRAVLDKLSLQSTGRFTGYDGRQLPW
ncbi:SDR family oxidoreductase [Parasphingopyxis algicola]|uniref:SDR family oxidoreductase n=1 Tax=Parasphingopyxis algicola TaxID=2026624 RepID=UPI0015A2633B|nr:SDR family oxidoreductase [Parasphingopyxis algicola]QLC25460.1 SDR family oxidoreductase [Parasphingopyxis algicola]